MQTKGAAGMHDLRAGAQEHEAITPLRDENIILCGQSLGFFSFFFSTNYKSGARILGEHNKRADDG